MKNYNENNIKAEDQKQIEKIDIRFKFRTEMRKHRRSFGF
jgi:hypothetical protein